MIDLYTWNTPNGRKVSIMLEELGMPYEVHAVNIGKDEQMTPEFLKISPNNKIPAIVDRDNGRSMMESAAIMLYLSEKAGGALAPKDEDGRWRMMEWLMFQMGGVGPILGQVHHFVKYNPGKAPYAEERFTNEAHRLYRVMNTRLGEAKYFAGDDYSIADIATFPWIARHDWQQIDLNDYPNVRRWYVELANRPAVQKGFDIPAKVQDIPMPA